MSKLTTIYLIPDIEFTVVGATPEDPKVNKVGSFPLRFVGNRHVHSLFDFLLNDINSIDMDENTDSQGGSSNKPPRRRASVQSFIPKLIAPSAFLNATMKKSQLHNGGQVLHTTLEVIDNRKTQKQTQVHKLQITGTLLPPNVNEMLKMISEYGDFVSHLRPTSTSVGLNRKTVSADQSMANGDVVGGVGRDLIGLNYKDGYFVI